MPKITSEKIFIERFPEIATAFQNFAIQEGIDPAVYEFTAAFELKEGRLNVAAWYPVGFNFESLDGSQRYDWVCYEAEDGFTLVSE